MGFFDKIKKAIDDSGLVDAAKSAIKNFTESTEEKVAEAPKETVAKEENVIKKETKPKAPPKPACEYGECSLCEADGYEKKLYFTCDKEKSCPKKSKYECGKLWDEEMFPVIKAYATYKNSNGWDNRQKNLRSVANKFVKIYIPELSGYDFNTEISNSIEFSGVDKNNQFLVYLANLKRKNVEILPEKKKQFQEIILLIKDYVYKYNRVLDANAEWLYNPSLYKIKRSSFVIQNFLDFGNPKWTKAHLYDNSIVDINQFFNADGTIKEIGEEGDLGNDTLWGVIGQWYENNKNEEVFAKEVRMAICSHCLRRSNCNMIGMHDDCPAFKAF